MYEERTGMELDVAMEGPMVTYSTCRFNFYVEPHMHI